MAGLIIDNFAGGGGASTGIELALGRRVDVAINHDIDAIALHEVNHPHTQHYHEDVWSIDPVKVCNGKQVDLAWFSPDCTHFSKAKGGKPVSKKIRGLAWVSLRWASLVRPRVIILENVEEFKTWGPIRRGRPIKSRKGETFKKFIRQLEDLDYQVEFRELIAADYGAPTKRKRFFMIARSDGKPIKWPAPMYAPREKAKALNLPAYHDASSIIDWKLPGTSIFNRPRPLSEATMRRIARGLQKFVFDEARPYLVQIGQTGFTSDRSSSINQPLKTIVTKNEFCLLNPFMVPIGYGEAKNQLPRVHGIDKPLPTIVSSNKHFLVTPYFAHKNTGHVGSSIDKPIGTITCTNKHCLMTPYLIDYHFKNKEMAVKDPYPTITTVRGHYMVAPYIMVNNTGHPGTSAKDPLATITTGGHHFATTAFISKTFGGFYTGAGSPLKEPLPTVTAVDHNSLIQTKFGCSDNTRDVKAFLMKYYGTGENVDSVNKPLATVTSKNRFGLVTIKNKEYQIVDITMRMLTARELYNAQGFPPDYIIDRDARGNKYPVSKQIARCGNAVPPPFAEALTRANLPELCVGKKIESMKYLYEYNEQQSIFNPKEEVNYANRLSSSK